MAVHVHLKNEFTEDKKCHNLMSWLIYAYFINCMLKYQDLQPESDCRHARHLEGQINRIHHWCSVSTRKSQPKDPPFQWETQQASFPTGMVDPRVGIFLSTLNTNDGFYLQDFPVNTEHQWSILFLTYHPRIVQVNTPSLCLNMEVSDVNEQTKNLSKVKQLWYQNVPFVLTKKTHTHTWHFYS